ncbi:MAG: xanthine dehydrogenase family protein molybdopterin-binding subunit [Syntrophaceticus sp.]|jgi:CO/xanthine dehydrogenase Mo-binding subunit
MEYKYIGKPLPRPDAISKATGKAVYLDDIRIPGMLHAAILSPEYAHAKIINIDTSSAEKMPGVVKVVTGKECRIRYGDNIADQTPMAVDKVRYAGEPVAAVVAETLEQANAAVEKIKVEYEPLPVYTDAREAMKEDAVLIHEHQEEYKRLPTLKCIPDTNVANYYRLIKGKGEEGFEEADVIVEGEFNYPIGSAAAMEPHGSIVWFKEDQSIECWSSSVCPFIIRQELAHTFDMPVSEVRVHIPEIGGSFGYKSDITVELTIAWIASFVPGRPVKWVATRREDFTSTLTGHGIRTYMKLGAKKNGKLVAIKSKILHSGGAFAETPVNVTITATHNCGGPYEYEHCFMEGYTVYTNTTPVGAFRGYGHPEAQFATERLMDMLARKLDMDPLKLREVNYLREGSIVASGEKMWKTNGDVQAAAKKIQEAIFDGDKPEEDEDYYYGRGFAALSKAPKGATFSTKGCYMKMNIDGSVSINMGGAEQGQGLRTVVKQVAAEALQIPPEKIHCYTEIDTQFSPYEWQTIGSMFTVQGGRAVIRAANKLIAILKKTASQVLKADEDMLDYNGEYVYLRNDPSIKVAVKDLARGYITSDGITIGEIAQASSDARLPRYSNPDLETGQGTLGVEYTFGAQGAQIRVEKKTGRVIVDHFASSFDIGRVINPLQARGTVLGGVLMGIGAALHEELIYDEQGHQKNPHYGRYRIPKMRDIPPKSTVDFIENPGAVGPYGARGIGEHPFLAVVPAILNAIYDATGIDFYEIPITPEKMKQALADRKENA